LLKFFNSLSMFSFPTGLADCILYNGSFLLLSIQYSTNHLAQSYPVFSIVKSVAETISEPSIGFISAKSWSKHIPVVNPLFSIQ